MQKDIIYLSMSDTARNIVSEKFFFPPDIIKTIKSDKEAWKNYNRFSDSQSVKGTVLLTI